MKGCKSPDGQGVFMIVFDADAKITRAILSRGHRNDYFLWEMDECERKYTHLMALGWSQMSLHELRNYSGINGNCMDKCILGNRMKHTILVGVMALTSWTLVKFVGSICYLCCARTGRKQAL